MKDNVSLIFITIVAVLLMVVLPLVSVLERQDNMSYNLVMKLTTSFADEVRTRGYIDASSYDKFVQGLAATGNSYDIKMEAHKKTLIKDKTWAESNPTYVEDTLVDYNADIFEAINTGDAIYKEANSDTGGQAGETINDKSKAYLLQKGDEFYIKVKNTNITAASMVYSYIAGNLKETIININYGGSVNQKSWDKFSEVEGGMQQGPEIVIGLPKNTQNITPIMTFEQDEFDPSEQPFYYYFNLSEPSDQVLKFMVDIRGASTLNAEITDNNKILDYIELDGFEATKSVRMITEFKYEITLTGITTNTVGAVAKVCKIVVKNDLASNSSGISTRTEGTEFTIFDDTHIHSVIITGPFRASTNTAITASASGKIQVLAETQIYFIVKYTAITQQPTEDGIKLKLQGVEFEGNYSITNITYDSVKRTASARINVSPTLQSDLFMRPDNYLWLEEGSAYTELDEEGNPTAYSAVSPKFDIINVKVWDFGYTGAVQLLTVPYTGTYKLETWGAQGGTAGSGTGGKGGYSRGNIYLTAGQIVYVYVGQKPADGKKISNSPGGWNGGGTSGKSTDNATAAGGGGATDIRTVLDNLNSRLIVAGGGGGGTSETSRTGGSGGGSLRNIWRR